MEVAYLFIVARHNVELYEYLKQEFAGEAVAVILDRRRGERRWRIGPPGPERRLSDRRSRSDADETVRTRGFVVVPAGHEEPATAAAAG